MARRTTSRNGGTAHEHRPVNERCLARPRDLLAPCCCLMMVGTGHVGSDVKQVHLAQIAQSASCAVCGPLPTLWLMTGSLASIRSRQALVVAEKQQSKVDLQPESACGGGDSLPGATATPTAGYFAVAFDLGSGWCSNSAMSRHQFVCSA